MKYISVRIFLMSFFIGIFVVYALGPEKKIIYIYPSLDNIDKYLIKSESGECFKYQANEITCPNV